MDYTIAIDPGMRRLGWALFLTDRLVRAGALTCSLTDAGAVAVFYAQALALVLYPTHSVMELPQIYPGPRQKGDPNDLISIAAVGALVVGYLRPKTLRFVSPADWKGQLPKDVSHHRIFDKLSILERSVLDELPATQARGDAMDAIGIGLYGVGRRA